jgi:hypothetical protein
LRKKRFNTGFEMRVIWSRERAVQSLPIFRLTGERARPAIWTPFDQTVSNKKVALTAFESGNRRAKRNGPVRMESGRPPRTGVRDATQLYCLAATTRANERDIPEEFILTDKVDNPRAQGIWKFVDLHTAKWLRLPYKPT